jgi:hypothetical protein
MKLKTFIITFAGFIIILSGSIIGVIYELSSIRDMNLNAITDRLYNENIKIMSEIIANIPPDSYGTLNLPSSWAQIYYVDTQSLTILASTTQADKGKYIYSVPNLLDQGKAIIRCFKTGKPSVIKAKDYLIVAVPAGKTGFAIGLKPRSWEAALINSQLHDISKMSSAIIRNLIIFAFLGIVLSFFLAMIISWLLSGMTTLLFKNLEDLSLGNLEAEPPSLKAGENKVFRDSFIRIKTSLKMALERLGAK